MHKKINIYLFLFVSFFVFTQRVLSETKTSIHQIEAFEAVNHPQVAYWFFSKDMLDPKRYQEKIDSLCRDSKYTLIFLTARNGVNFYETEKMHPVFENLVKYAHQKGLKIGLQLWDKKYKVAIENTERMMLEGEILLDESGKGTYSAKAKYVRDAKSILKSELFKVYAFRKAGSGFYEPKSLIDITAKCIKTEGKETVELKIDEGSKLKGYTAYILTQHYYNFCSNHCPEVVENLTQVLKAYSDIPFDGVGLDEYTNMRVSPTFELKKTNDVFRGRTYSLGMAEKMTATSGLKPEQVLFNMRYAPLGESEVRIKAINHYMDAMRSGTLAIETAIYDQGKAVFGPNTFIGLHNTHHNSLDGDEIWQTGLNWWRVKRDYGHTDENSSPAIQMGIGFMHPKNVMYNMFYDKSLDKIVNKASSDLTYGIRTHYHAINDIQKWGVSVEMPEALKEINRVENQARLLNHFNPPFPKIKLLVIFGMEELANWYPDSTKRGVMDINKSLGIEEKVSLVWNAGYLAAILPTDLIANGALKLNAQGKAQIQGHEFDAILFMYPQYARKSTLDFLKKYVDKGGKLMVEGSASSDFDGNDIRKQWNEIAQKAMFKSFAVSDVAKLGIVKREYPNGVQNEDGSYTFTGINEAQSIKLGKNNDVFVIRCVGLAAIKTDANGKLEKLVATNFSSLSINGKTVLSVEKPTDISVVVENDKANVTILDADKSNKVSSNF